MLWLELSNGGNQMDQYSSSTRKSEADRRNFLKSCGRFAATVPPAMTVMLATSLNSNAIAKSTGAGDSGVHTGGGDSGGGGHADSGIRSGGGDVVAVVKSVKHDG
jgi:hypothetical protein